MKLEELVPLMIKEFLWVYDKEAEVDDKEHFLELGPYSKLVDEEINTFSKKIIKVIKKNKDDLCTTLTDYLVKLSEKRGFTHGIMNKDLPIDNYFNERMDYLKELSNPLMLRVVLPKFFESIDYDELKTRFKTTYRTQKQTKATVYLALKKFIKSKDKGFNDFIDSKINKLLEE